MMPPGTNLRYAIGGKGERLTLARFLQHAEKNRVTKDQLLALPLGGSPLLTEKAVKEKRPATWGEKVRKISDALARLDKERAARYGDVDGGWLAVGMAIKHELDDDTGYELWREWSSKAGKNVYDPDVCRAKWKTFARVTGDQRLGLGSLIFWANEDLGLPPDFPDVRNLVWETTGHPDDPVTYSVTVGDLGELKHIQASDLQSFTMFDRRVMEQLGKKLPEVPRGIWPRFVQNLFGEVKKDRRPREAGAFGTFITLVVEFLNRARSSEPDLKELVRGRPAIIGDRVFFQIRDLQVALRDQRFFDYKMHQVIAALKNVGARKHKREKIDGKGLRPWSLPFPFDDAYDREAEIEVPRKAADDPNRSF